MHSKSEGKLIGQTLAHYKIIKSLGAGGMGEVYRAHDGRLGRDVALKILGKDLTSNPNSVARFQREARSVAALNHPNIVTIYSVEEVGGVPFLTMELVDGISLSAHIPENGLSVVEALALATQLADALTAAAEKGIIHRDLKPGNVMVTPKGRVKVLDFGLAKVLQEDENGAATLAATLAIHEADVQTRPGMILGTVAYMSPEQLEGEIVDQRSDIFSFGIVLYEMSTGRRPFRGKTSASVISAILRDSPAPLAKLRPELPGELIRIVDRCLEKDMNRRFQTPGALMEELQQLSTSEHQETTSPTGVSSSRTASTSSDSSSSSNFFPTRDSSQSRDISGSGTLSGSRKRSIAVLPFADLSQSGDQEYFCDGIAEEITSALASVEGLNVAARSSSFRFKGRDSDIREVGEVLNVDLVLEGSVRSAGNRLRITAQLISVGDGYHIWSERYDRSMEDIFEVQDEISDAIVKAMKVKIDEGEHPQLVRRGTSDVDAYHYYLRGRHCWNRRHQGVLPKAIEYFHKAIEVDPGYSLAYVGLADAYNVLGYYGFEPPNRSFTRARSAAEKALQINPEQAEAYNSLGYVDQHHEWAWTQAEKNYQMALKLRPDYAVANQWYGIFLSCRARHEEAIERITRARELDPLSPVINTAVGWLHYHAGAHEKAIKELSGTLDLDPNFPWLRYVLGQVHEALGRYDEARSNFQSAVESSSESAYSLAGLGHCLARCGDEAGASEILQRLDKLGETSYVSGADMALVYAGLRDETNMFQWLTKALDQRAVGLTYLGVDPRFNFARSDDRMKTLTQHLHIDF